MDYEKKYKEALEDMRAIYPNLKGDAKLAVEHAFPELRESEDERIRKEIIHYILYDANGVSEEQEHMWIAYLEKQKEQRPELYYDKELDIAAREFYLSGGANSPVDSTGLVPIVRMAEFGATWMKERMQKDQKHPDGCFTCDEYKKGYEEGRRNGFTAGYNKAIKEVEQKEQKPNIELIQKSWYMEGYHDRKFNKEPKWIIKTGEGGPRYEENPKYGQHIEKQDYSGLTELERAIHRGFLCAGVENVPVNIIKETAQDCLAHLPAEWSDDFDKEVENIHKRYPEVSYAKLTRIAYHFSKWANRCKDIEWSEEDEKIYAFIYDFFENCWWSTAWDISREQALKMLKSLRPIKQEWSEEDETIRQKLIHFISSPNLEGFMLASDERMFVSWLKSLHPMPKVAVTDGHLWKPSEEQMYSLGTVVKGSGDCAVGSVGYNLKELYEQLKKL